MMEKKEKILVAVTILMVAILAACFYYDRNSALIHRTLPYKLPDDVKLVDIDKHGFLFYRVSYEAKYEINAYNPEEILTFFVQAYGDSGQMLSNSDYQTMAAYMFENYYSYVDLKPNPAPGSGVWMQEADLVGGHHVLNFIVLEPNEHAYLYVYYTR
ncbi:MAG: hypothetical protein K6C38_09330 [Saccharofermentans sp.]|nr:hypothetical protein [Saccharofermentans sp.]